MAEVRLRCVKTFLGLTSYGLGDSISGLKYLVTQMLMHDLFTIANCASACSACRVRYCYGQSVSLSVCLSVQCRYCV